MAKGTHSIELDIPLENIWIFINNINNWAPLVSGYVKHRIINNQHSSWRLYGDIGIIKRNVDLHVKIIEQKDYDKISFTIASPTKKLTGSGFFHAEAISPSKKRITSELEMKEKGKNTFIINRVMTPFLHIMINQLSKRIADKLKNQ
ncbi:MULTISPECIES: SRPBCC family protein [Bacillus]|uniref:SRPBCC family protein n=1 Tax=Bacillus wiedmannii TaxID=1890302 RepID=A0A2C4YKY0_9BACI|nr:MULTISPECIES: SRPBCC family protein [Bacillus]PGD34749.1 hypothetical protein COM27_15325 [Bacillus wiedmannii]PHE76066.1 hypothetical protein COF77_12895 [Bacillus wiedmannii]HDR7656030.1 SRPBCC family protein [Bacillus wiedmannii]